MPFENPEPGIYWGYRCVKCNGVIALSTYKEGSSWYGSGAFTLDCVDWNCQNREIYTIADIRPIEVSSAT